jgi:hypothetical protein
MVVSKKLTTPDTEYTELREGFESILRKFWIDPSIEWGITISTFWRRLPKFYQQCNRNTDYHN